MVFPRASSRDPVNKKESNLILKVICHHFCCMLLVTQPDSGKMWAGTTPNGVNSKKQDLLGAAMGTGYHMVLNVAAFDNV